ncbi:PilZ domain-containing protein [Sphingomonas japonica]|uniref:PilZ domain-containing protein n=1 Tax=Sphingomonas japonica TaxID=511662 RepID=A0ABX0U624_9SPHN|nr:PilZ domain-containing protein [Sphingomonas japonica]NIJ24787.1 hypothetical protein [Sphingomonas japonica]
MLAGRTFSLPAEFEPAVLPVGRRAPRAPVSLDAKLGRGGLDRTLCRVTDLSPHGARIQTYSMLRAGSTIWLTLPGGAPISAHIAWADDYAAGLAFDDALPDGQFEALAHG